MCYFRSCFYKFKTTYIYNYLRLIITLILYSFPNLTITMYDAEVFLNIYGLNDELINKMKYYVNKNNNVDGIFKETDHISQSFIPPQLKYKEGPINESYIDALMNMAFYGTNAGSIYWYGRIPKIMISWQQKLMKKNNWFSHFSTLIYVHCCYYFSPVIAAVQVFDQKTSTI